jgi:hypothetical protein
LIGVSEGEHKPTDGIEQWLQTDPVLIAAQRDGVDVWSLWANLQRPVEERIRRLEMALDVYQMIRNTAKP